MFSGTGHLGRHLSLLSEAQEKDSWFSHGLNFEGSVVWESPWLADTPTSEQVRAQEPRQGFSHCHPQALRATGKALPSHHRIPPCVSQPHGLDLSLPHFLLFCSPPTPGWVGPFQESGLSQVRQSQQKMKVSTFGPDP